MKKVLISLVTVVILLSITMLTINAFNFNFEDVPEGKYYYEPAMYCAGHGYITGTSATTFEPNTKLSRAMSVQILSAIEGIDKTKYDKQIFDDVVKGKWYSSSIQWGYENKLTSGTGNNNFSPNVDVTRESFALMLMKYAELKGYDTTQRSADLDTKFKDTANISKWAKDAISWAVATGIMSGDTNSNLNPKNTCSRGEAAVMIKKFTESNLGNFAQDITVSRAFSDNMTIQRNEVFSVWGFDSNEADEGKMVQVTFKNMKAYGKVQGGKWKATFALTFPASSKPSELKVIGSDVEITFDNVLVGDVYYVMGQSNIYWSMNDLIEDLTNADEMDRIKDIGYEDESNIRLFRNSNTYNWENTGKLAPGTTTLYEDVTSDKAYWKLPSEGAKDFSAIGYMFAYNISKQTDVPIAMIEIDASGCPLTSWAPNELATKWGSDIDAYGNGVYYMKLGKAENSNLTIFPLQSRFAYNQQLYPLSQFSCAGILWYQGESDFLNTIMNYGKEEWTFSNELADLMTYYRSTFGNSDFPVYFIEFPTCYNLVANQAYIDTGTVRSELGIVPNILENSYVVSSADFWDMKLYGNSIHPYCKPEQAKRAAGMVLANEYEIGDITDYMGPSLDRVEYVDDYTTHVIFKNVGEGIEAFSEDYSGDIYGIQVLPHSPSYAEVNWVGYNYLNLESNTIIDTMKIIDKNTVEIKTTLKIYGVRYHAETDYLFPSQCNLCNNKYVPCIAFADYRDMPEIPS